MKSSFNSMLSLAILKIIVLPEFLLGVELKVLERNKLGGLRFGR
uniref:Uncharacterized protein n=1 Tax=Rhizophora mucronata TaxID=61149 RepID=A0A2P2PJW1_RHIMU